MNKKIGIIITTFLRDDLLYKSAQSLVQFIQPNWEIIIIDQDATQQKEYEFKNIPYYSVPYNSGLSYSRNYGVQKAKELDCGYVLISSDSFLMNESIKKLNYFIDNNLFGYDILGLYLSGCICEWEAKLNLIKGEGFELDFIDKDIKYSKQDNYKLFDCDIIKNFFIAKTDSLLKSPWDNNLLLGEHEDFFYQAKINNLKVGWTDLITAEKMKDRPEEYNELRTKNFNEGIQKLKEKYHIKRWVIYKNLENSKKD
jgi:glycosyltransferase involved in cell wall biosynthesis